MKTISITLAACALLLSAGTAPAQSSNSTAADSHADHANHGAPAASPAPSSTQPQSPLSDGEITRWDPRTLRVTLRHGEIKNLEMPPMTMVFRVRDPGVVGSLQPGDKVRFRAELVGGAYHVVHIEKAP